MVNFDVDDKYDETSICNENNANSSVNYDSLDNSMDDGANQHVTADVDNSDGEDDEPLSKYLTPEDGEF